MRFIVCFATLAAAAFAQQAGPRPGKYTCLSYADPKNPMMISTFVIEPNNLYIAFGKYGKYTYNAATKTVTWLTGSNKVSNFGGRFEVAGKVHKIWITPKAACENKD